MEKHRREKLKPWLIFAGILLAGYWFWTLNPVEDYVGRFIDFTDPKRDEHLRERFEKKSDGELLRLLHHGDSGKSGMAKAILGQRANPELFDVFVKKLKHPSKPVRTMARTLLQVNHERAVEFYMKDLERLPKDSDEYQQTLSILVHMKHEPVYPYVVEFAKREDGWKNGSARFLKELGNPEAIPILEDMLTQINDEYLFADLTRRNIQKAVQHLRAIAENQKIASTSQA